jgi:hypothetical protein
VSPGVFAGDEPSMATLMQDGLAQPRLVGETEWGDDRAARVHCVDQSFALERYPHRGIAQPAGVASGDHGLAEVKMIAMRIGQADDNTAGLLAGPAVFGKARKLLQQGQGPQLQRIKAQRIFLCRHPL